MAKKEKSVQKTDAKAKTAAANGKKAEKAAKADQKVQKKSELPDDATIVRVEPKNKFDADKWPSKEKYFRNEVGTVSVKGKDGSDVLALPKYEDGDYPMYKKDSYCAERVGGELGLPAQQNMMAVVFPEGGKAWKPIFRSDDKDNIEIAFWNLDRELILLNKTKPEGTTEQMSDNKKHPGYYHRTRLHPSLVKDGIKYISPEKKASRESYPFLPPQIVEAWENGEEIETLVITEGEFKAMKACMCGGHVIGIGGIQMFYNTTTREVYRDVLRIVQDCKVKNLVFLHDGDCTDISEKSLKSRDGSGQPDKDLAERPRNFLNSARDFFRIHHKAMPKVKIYWEYINSKSIPGEPKGLDDLLNALPKDQERIIREMEDVNCITAFFHRASS